LFLLYEHVEGSIYGFGVKIIEVTKVAKKAKIPKRVQGIWTTTRHVVRPVTEKAEISIKTARHIVICPIDTMVSAISGV
jgi:hypothetical protein